MKQRFIVLLVLAMISMLFARQPEDKFQYPININIETSKQQIEVGDIIDIIINAELDENHKNYSIEEQYVFVNMKNRIVYALNERKIPADDLERKIKWHYEKYEKDNFYEIISSEDDIILNLNNRVRTLTFQVRILKRPKGNYIEIPLTIFKFDTIEDYGGYPNYIYSKSTNRYGHERSPYSIRLTFCDLEPEKSTGNNIKDHSLILEDNLSQNYSTVEFGPIDSLRFEYRPTYKVLINTTIDIPLPDNVSNVSCDANIGSATGSGSIITFIASGTTGAIGDIDFIMNNQNCSISVELISFY
jgi:hypothetical protein